jgi:hypothetical protein
MIPPTIFFRRPAHRGGRSHADGQRNGIFAAVHDVYRVAALILGKSVLIADMLPFINRFPERPLIYNVVWKTLIYLLMSALIHYLERLYDFARQAGGIVTGNEKLLAEIVWPHFWATQIILLVLIVMYCTMHELTRVIGREKVLRIFFDPCRPRRFEFRFVYTPRGPGFALLQPGNSPRMRRRQVP